MRGNPAGCAGFPRAVGREENLLLVFLAFHGPAFSTARRPPRFCFCKKHGSSLNFCGLPARVKPQNIGGSVAPSGSNTCSNGRCSPGFLVPKLTSNLVGLLPRLSNVTISASLVSTHFRPS